MARIKKESKKSQAFMEFLMTYGWAILVVFVIIWALAYFGVIIPCSPLDKANQGTFKCIQHRAEHQKEFDSALHSNWDYVWKVHKGCKKEYPEQSCLVIDENKYINIPKPFCSLCTSFWDECMAEDRKMYEVDGKDATPKERFEAECECTDYINSYYEEIFVLLNDTTGEIFRLHNNSKKEIDYETITETIFDSSLKIEVTSEQIYVDLDYNLNDMIVFCVKENFRKINSTLNLTLRNGSCEKIRTTDKCLSAKEKEEVIYYPKQSDIHCKEWEAYNVSNDKCKIVDYNSYCSQNPQDTERCECINQTTIKGQCTEHSSPVSPSSCQDNFTLITKVCESDYISCTKAVPKEET